MTKVLAQGSRNGLGILSQTFPVGPPLGHLTQAAPAARNLLGTVDMSQFNDPDKRLVCRFRAHFTRTDEWVSVSDDFTFIGGQPVGKGFTFGIVLTADANGEWPDLAAIECDAYGMIAFALDADVT